MTKPLPALKPQVEPTLPLHNGPGWLSVTYIENDEPQIVNLKTFFKDAHKISNMHLNNASATAALYRIILSISYSAYLGEASKASWINQKNTLIKENLGFSSEWVETYFEKWDDRFYLIHPTLPFLQDASLYETYTHSLNLPEDKQYKKWQESLKSISNLYPKEPSTASEGGQKAIWGLPEEEIYSSLSNFDTNVNILLTSLLHHRYSHSATLRGTRSFLDGTKNKEAYHAAHAFRCAVHYIPQGKSIFQSLLIAMKPYNELLEDIPEWERDVDKETGYLDKIGKDLHYSEVLHSFDAPRSSVNLTHLALIFVPEVDSEGKQKDNGGQVQQLRRILFSFKEFKDADGSKLSFPLSWNPYVAIKSVENKAYKLVSNISEMTSMGNANLRKIPLLKEAPDIKIPEAIQNLNNMELMLSIPRDHQKINIYIYSGDASQEKTYSDLVLREKYPLSREDALKAKDWFEVGEILRKELKNKISDVRRKRNDDEKKKANSDTSLEIEVLTQFWNEYSLLFESALENGCEPINKYENQIWKIMSSIYETATQSVMYSSPTEYSKYRIFLRAGFNKAMEGR